MQSFFAKCAAVGIVAGGFALTGDLSRLVDRGRRLLEARTVPSEATPEPATQPAASVAPQATAQPFTQPRPTAPETLPGSASTAPSAADGIAASPRALGQAVPFLDSAAPAGTDSRTARAVTPPPPPAAGQEFVELSHLSAGQRVLVWVRRSGGPGGGRTVDFLALDLIDPVAGEALEQRHPALSAGGDRLVYAAPRRVVVTPQSKGRIARGAALQIVPVHGVNGPGGAEDLGTVLAVDLDAR